MVYNVEVNELRSEQDVEQLVEKLEYGEVVDMGGVELMTQECADKLSDFKQEKDLELENLQEVFVPL